MGVQNEDIVVESVEGGSVDETQDPGPPAPRAASAWLLTLLASVLTGVVWFGAPRFPVDLLPLEPLGVPTPDAAMMAALIVGPSLAIGVYLLLLGAASNRRVLVDNRERLRSVRDRQTLFPEPREPRSVRPVTLRYLPAVVALVLISGATALHALRPEWAEGYIGRYVEPWAGISSPVALGIVATVLIWLPALVGVRRRIVASLLAIEFDAATRSTDLALGAVHHMPVMVSVCAPDGRRTHLNAHFIEVVGLGEEALLDRAWMDLVAEDDREAVKQAFADPGDAEPKELEFGLTGVGGMQLWIRESFAPRFDDKGQVAGYLATGLDITAQVQNESDLQASIDRFQEEANSLRDESWQLKDELETARTEHKAEVRELKDELTKTKRQRDRWQEKVEASQAAAKEAKDQAAVARNELSEGRNEVKSAKGEIKAAQAEAKEARAETQRIESQNRKLEQTIEKLEQLVESQRTDEDALKAQLESTAQQLDKSRATAAEARRRESQLRTKINRLTSRVQELKDKMDEAMGAHAQAAEESAELKASMQARHAEMDRGLAMELRPRLDAALAVMDGLRAQRLGESQLGELESALASVASMAAYVDASLGRSPDEHEGAEESVRPFDLRHAVQSVARLLEPIGTERAVEVVCEVNPDFPPQVCGDSAVIREALFLLGASAIETLRGGKVVLRLSADGQTAMDVAARCEIFRKDEGPGAEVIESLFGAGASDDPKAVQARLAWKLVSKLKGEHGVEPSGDGFKVWFSIAMLRHRSEDVTGGARVQAAPAAQPTGRAAGQQTVQTAPQAAQAAQPAQAQPAPAGPQRPEQTLRLPQEMLTSNLGDVLELGPSSARVQTTKKLSGTVTLSINTDDKLSLEAEVESCEKVGLRSSEAVLRFTGVTAEQHRMIQQIAMAHRRQSTIRVGA